MKKSKLKFITLAVLLLLLAVPVFVFAQEPLIKNPAPGFFVDKPTVSDTTVEGIISLVVDILLGIVGMVALLFVIVGGLQYIAGLQIGGTKEGEKKVTVAKKTITNALMGLVIVILSYVIITVVINAVFGRVNRSLPTDQQAGQPGAPSDAGTAPFTPAPSGNTEPFPANLSPLAPPSDSGNQPFTPPPSGNTGTFTPE